jgi:hypothetical protein
MPYPDISERAARVEEAVAVLRALWGGGPVTRESRFYPLVDAVALPVPDPPPPVVVGGQSPAGARLAARVGDGWACRPDQLEALRPHFEEALAATGRRREEVRIVVGWENSRSGEDALAGSPWVTQPADEALRWLDAGANEVVLLARTTADVDALVEAGGRR